MSKVLNNMVVIGGVCKAFRMSLGVKQIEVAYELGYSLENISSFENGRNDNYRIFMWYLSKGLTYEKLIRLSEEWGEWN